VKVHLLDGTYELFRHHYGQPADTSDDDRQVGATKGVVSSVVGMLQQGATHVGVATDHVIESFRNDLWLGYKTSAGMDPVLLAQFPLLEEALELLGVTVWAMVELEADDALAAAAKVAAADDRVEQVIICTPDKDLGQCVGGKVVQLDRRKDVISDAAAVEAKFGVPPESIPDYLALVGDSADGFPGLPGWGAKSAAAVLARYGHLEAIPDDASKWDVTVRGSANLAATLAQAREAANLFKNLATLRADAEVLTSVDELEWHGPEPGFDAMCDKLGADSLPARVGALRKARGW
jgi:5'-3' exonuclease